MKFINILLLALICNCLSLTRRKHKSSSKRIKTSQYCLSINENTWTMDQSNSVIASNQKISFGSKGTYYYIGFFNSNDIAGLSISDYDYTILLGKDDSVTASLYKTGIILMNCQGNISVNDITKSIIYKMLYLGNAMIINTSDGKTMICQDPLVKDFAIVSYAFTGSSTTTLCF